MSLEAALSRERLAKYRAWARGDEDRALALYALNVAASEAFYTSLHVLEITLRNAVHDKLTIAYGQHWFSHPDVITDRYQRQKVLDAAAKIGAEVPDGKVVAELTFGFWTALFGRANAPLWGEQLRSMFSRGVPLRRKQIARRLNDIRNLRNRIAHHEPVIQFDLQRIHSETRELIGWMSLDALDWCDARCRFRKVHPGHQIIMGNLMNPELETKLE